MKVCAVQCASVSGDVEENVRRHVVWVRVASRLNAKFVFFPELSITNYEPGLADAVALGSGDPALVELEGLSEELGITIAVGVPTRTAAGVQIGMWILAPGRETQIYGKRLLHSDEWPYFVPGDRVGVVEVGDQRLGLAICYESLQTEHFEALESAGVHAVVASVAKSAEGAARAHERFPECSRAFGLPVIMSNALGPADDFVCAGQSAAWRADGACVAALGDAPGVVVFDGWSEGAAYPLRIRQASSDDEEAVVALYRSAREHLEAADNDQWNYLTDAIVRRDLRKGRSWVLAVGPLVLGAVVLDDHQEPEYATVSWSDTGPCMVVHRLAVDPMYRRCGYARMLVDFVEERAREIGYTSIRLDVYRGNPGALRLYEAAGYVHRGNVRFPNRVLDFLCLEYRIG